MDPHDQSEIYWNYKLQGYTIQRARCHKDALVIIQSDSLQGPGVVPRRPDAELTDEDKNQLERLNLPPECCKDEGSIMKARMDMDNWHTVVGVERNKPGEPLSRKLILKKIEDVTKTTLKAGSKRRFIGVVHDYSQTTLYLQFISIIMDQDREILVTGASKMAT